jgi:hypothetical protein
MGPAYAVRVTDAFGDTAVTRAHDGVPLLNALAAPKPWSPGSGCGMDEDSVRTTLVSKCAKNVPDFIERVGLGTH